ncbi:oxygenase MpaB family protein [Nocardia sp. NPDC004278]
MHKGIGGVDHVGRRYHAWEPEAYFFVLATAHRASEIVATRFGSGLTEAQRAELRISAIPESRHVRRPLPPAYGPASAADHANARRTASHCV